MSLPTVKSWAFRLSRIFLAMVLTATSFGAVSSLISSSVGLFVWPARQNLSAVSERLFGIQLPSYGSRWMVWGGGSSDDTTSAESSGEKIYKNILTIDVTGETIKARRDVFLNKDDPLLERLRTTVMRPEPQWDTETYRLFGKVFGQLFVNQRVVAFSPAELEIDEGAPEARMRTSSEVLNFGEVITGRAREVTVEAYSGSLPPPEFEVIVNMEGSRLIPAKSAPRHLDPKKASFIGAGGSFSQPVAFSVLPPESNPTEESSQSIKAALARFNDGYRVLEPLLLGLLYTTPFLLFFRLRRYPAFNAGGPEPLWFAWARVLLVLYAGLSLTNCVSDLLLLRPLLSWGDISGFSHLQSMGSIIFSGVGALVMTFSVLVWPKFTKEWEHRMQSGGGQVPEGGNTALSKRASMIFALISLMLWMAGLSIGVLLATVSTRGVLPCQGDCARLLEVAFFATAATTLLASCLWLSYEVFGKRNFVRAAASVMVVMGIYTAAEEVASSFWLRPLLASILLLPMAFSFARVTSPIVRKVVFAVWWRNQSRKKRFLLTLGLTGLVFLLVWPPLENFGTVVSWSYISTVSWAVGRLGIFVLLFLLIQLMRGLGTGAGRYTLSPAALAAGDVLALSFFFLPSRGWLFLLVVFPLGYLLMRRWLIMPELPADTVTDSLDRLRGAVRDKIKLKDAERSLRGLRKELLGKLGKGELSFTSFTEKVGELEKVVDEGGSADGGREVLALGPRMSPRERAKTGATYGLLFSVPWIILFARDFFASAMPSDYTGLLSLMTSAALSMLQWPLFGFFFGYFYPHIRGTDGMRKGLSFFVFIFVPYAAATAAVNPVASEIWFTFVVWSLQLFVQCMLLGLIAGDYETLKMAGLGWRHLIDVHNLGALTAWGSSVLVATGAAVTTLLTSGAAGFLSEGLKVLLPTVQLPQVK